MVQTLSESLSTTGVEVHVFPYPKETFDDDAPHALGFQGWAARWMILLIIQMIKVVFIFSMGMFCSCSHGMKGKSSRIMVVDNRLDERWNTLRRFLLVYRIGIYIVIGRQTLPQACS